MGAALCCVAIYLYFVLTSYEEAEGRARHEEQEEVEEDKARVAVRGCGRGASKRGAAL